MNREELAALIADITGLTLTPAKLETIMLAADAYAATVAQRQRVLYDAGSAS